MSREYVLAPFRAPMDLQLDYARELNEQQFAAVTAPPGPSLVIAGAGSGKTRTLTYRVSYLLEQGIPPERILLLTFTNKAAREMMRRVADLLGQELAQLWGGTFHSVGNRILRQHAPLLGFLRGFSIMDREDSKHLVATCVAEAAIDPTATRFPKAEVLDEVFSLAANTRKPVAAVLREHRRDFVDLAPQLEEIQRRYTERKRATNAMDFDDLLVLWLKLLQEQSDVGEHYQRRFQFILVDEYQDTNRLQSDLIDFLAARHHNVMVVGDDAQSIYGWRGANFQNILKFRDRYPDAKLYKIETNYRSTPEILTLANAAIAPNVHQYAKLLAPSRKSGAKPSIVVCGDASEQAAFVAQRVLELREEGADLNKMAVLYRSHFHALELQLELTRRNIPFSITSGIRFFEQAHIKDVTAYLKLVTNPRDELSFKRLAKLLPGIGARAAEKLWAMFSTSLENPALNSEPRASQTQSGEPKAEVPASAAGSPAPVRRSKRKAPVLIPEAKSEPEKSKARHGEGSPASPEANPVARGLQRCAASVPKKAASAWAQFMVTVAQLEAPGVRNNPSKMIQHVVDAGYNDYLKESYPNYRSRLDDLDQLGVFARQFATVEEFLTQLALLTNLEAEDEQPARRDDELLRLSTVHQAKGLEFDIVFVVMLCDGLFPSARSLETPEGEEEERRLLYVAVTRARNDLYLSYPLVRRGFGPASDISQKPSRFLKQLPRDLFDELDVRPSALRSDRPGRSRSADW
jgi:ATP-dependent DNA helicase UvrD/PcrA